MENILDEQLRGWELKEAVATELIAIASSIEILKTEAYKQATERLAKHGREMFQERIDSIRNERDAMDAAYQAAIDMLRARSYQIFPCESCGGSGSQTASVTMSEVVYDEEHQTK